MSENEARRPGTSSSLELPPINNHIQRSFGQHFQSPRAQQLLPSMMPNSPPGRSSTLPPIARPRPRKSSVSQNARKAKHERTKSKDHARRLSIGERKAFSAEPQGPPSDGDLRWQGLIEAATSATEADSDRELTPVLCSLLDVFACLTLLTSTDRPIAPYQTRKNPTPLLSPPTQ